ncbi:MAG: DUF952 domain-containing protein [Planctomycetaceae bacterium]|nr:DUF952 domain-containing protein [Planctomycetaceae bacterium]
MILHITSREDWNKALNAGQYCPESLRTEGYIHCSKPSQVVEVANFLFKGQTGLVLLVIDPAKLNSRVKWECSQGSALYPHLYGPLNLTAVKAVLDFPP